MEIFKQTRTQESSFFGTDFIENQKLNDLKINDPFLLNGPELQVQDAQTLSQYNFNCVRAG